MARENLEKGIEKARDNARAIKNASEKSETVWGIWHGSITCKDFPVPYRGSFEMMTCEKFIESQLGTNEEREEQAKQDAQEVAGMMAAINATPPLDNEVKETLRKQLQLLSERAKTMFSANELAMVSRAMCEIAVVLREQNQSLYGEHFPCTVQLPVADLFALYKRQADISSRLAGLR